MRQDKPTSAGATVEFRHVSKRYGRDVNTPGTVEDLSLTVPAGEICVLVGPSGCGKTTTLRMVNRLVDPTSGQVLIDGTDIATVEPTTLRRGIGYVIQQIGLFPHQSIAQNVATVPSLLGWDRQRADARVDELLTLVGLDPARYRSRYPSQLSGGERQRVGVARALAVEPPVMLMDEPFGAVDPIVRERLQDEFLRLHRQLGMTVLLVTHDIDEAIKMGSRVAVMRQGGHLEQYATPSELLSRPASDFVAQFVGADRGLKHLALITVGEVMPVSLQTITDDAAPDGRAIEGGVVRLDAAGRPLGWVEQASSGGAEPLVSLPTFRPSETLRDALSTLLATEHRIGLLVDEDGQFIGGLTLESIGAALRAGADGLGDQPLTRTISGDGTP